MEKEQRRLQLISTWFGVVLAISSASCTRKSRPWPTELNIAYAKELVQQWNIPVTGEPKIGGITDETRTGLYWVEDGKVVAWMYVAGTKYSSLIDSKFSFQRPWFPSVEVPLTIESGEEIASLLPLPRKARVKYAIPDVTQGISVIRFTFETTQDSGQPILYCAAVDIENGRLISLYQA